MKAFCISHRKDVDGLGAASIVSAATGAGFLLSDYDDLIENLGRVPADATEFYLCDLGTDNADAGDFLREMKRLSAQAKVTYIDHHFMSGSTKRKLKRAGVKVVHDSRECSSILAYRTFRDGLPEGARLIALCGAVTDYMDDSPISRKMMEEADRQFVLLEASMLAYALGKKGGKGDFSEMIVRELAAMKRPHEIEGVPEAAVEQLTDVARMGEVVKAEGRKLGRLAYMHTAQHSTGNVAKLLIGAFGVPVGVALKAREGGWYEVSLRSTSECKVHLGRTIAKISASLGGSGGGHKKAAGCRIPVDKEEKMLGALSRVV